MSQGKNQNRVVELGIKDRERLATLETVTETTKSHLKYLYDDFKNHRNDDLEEFKALKQILNNHEILFTKIESSLQTISETVQKQTKIQEKFVTYKDIFVGVVITITTLSGIVWSVIKLLSPFFT